MIKRIIHEIELFFGISRKEARAALVLMVFSFCMLWAPFVFKRWILPFVPVPAAPVDTKKLDSLAALLESEETITNNIDTYAKSDRKTGNPRPTRLFPFDPNHASTDQLEELGMPQFMAKRIDKYRSKGGKFRKKEDLLRIYDFPADLYNKLEPYITLASTPARSVAFQPPEARASTSFKPGPPRAEFKSYVKPTIAPFDINTADTTQLIRLKGIGSKLSLRILKFRDGLGGFYSEKQFAEIFGLDSVALSELNKYARTITPVRKLNINTATPEQLNSHSYLRNRKLATIIVNYREQHGPYQSAEDLKKVRILDEKTIEKLSPYLEF
jgi:competence protein ComEA